MRTRLAMLAGLAVLIALVGSPGAPARTSAHVPRWLIPNAVAFVDRSQGVLGTGYRYGGQSRGAIEQTSDGGRTWRVVRRTARPVVAALFFHDAFYVRLDNGTTLEGKGTSWQRIPQADAPFKGYCPKRWIPTVSADVLDRTYGREWSICTRQPAAGNEAKAVYRNEKRVAFTPMTGGHSPGQISSYGYATGIARGFNGFGIVWESRGTLYVTRDGGRTWRALPKVCRPEIDFGDWVDANAYPNGTAFALLSVGYSEKRRLIETTDYGRTWRVVHRWR